MAHKVVYAVNCGGEAHTDSFGIQYLRDMSKVGTSSDYGKQLLIGRVPQKDQILYQTERYHTSTFGYDIPITEDGRYLLVLKFSEVYFNAPNMKVSFLDISICLYFKIVKRYFQVVSIFDSDFHPSRLFKKERLKSDFNLTIFL